MRPPLARCIGIAPDVSGTKNKARNEFCGSVRCRRVIDRGRLEQFFASRRDVPLIDEVAMGEQTQQQPLTALCNALRSTVDGSDVIISRPDGAGEAGTSQTYYTMEITPGPFREQLENLSAIGIAICYPERN